MGVLEEAATKLSFEEWLKEIDKGFEEAMARGEIPIKSKEEMKAEADAIWEKAHTKM